MKCLIIASATSKSAMTPSRSGRMAWMLPGSAAQHHLRLLADRQDLALAGLRGERNDRRFVENDPPSLHIDQRVGCPEVDAHVRRKQPDHSRQHSLCLCYYWINLDAGAPPDTGTEVRWV
jgi:hypothetical protein